jgi:DNA helicase-2/ATP-dependent DNA helicase PcrA
MSTLPLDQALDELNTAQRDAANWGTNPLLVLAGPGSGKTRVLTCRIARLLMESPGETYRILALTFTNKAADEMRGRVVQYAPDCGSRMFLGTFHSFCADILRQHGTHIGIPPNFEIYSQDEDLESILSDAVDTLPQNAFPDGAQPKKTLPIIKRLKAQLVLPENCQDAFKDAEIDAVMALVYPAYEAELVKRKALDFDSLILRTHQLLTKFPAFARRYRTVFRYVCIDESPACS